MLSLFLVTGCARVSHRPGGSTANTSSVPDASSAAPVTAGGAPTGEHLGTVHVIGTAQRFVLIQTPAAQPVATLVDGQALVCRTGGSVTATLRVSHERRPLFVVADVSAGEPHVGDEVFIDTAPARTTVLPPQAPSPVSPAPAAAPDFRANPALPPTR